MDEWKFSIGETAVIKTSLEKGVVVGRAQYEFAENSYLLRYTDSRGTATEQWWTESALD